MNRSTEKRDGKNVIPLRNAVCGIDMPYWKIETESNIQQFLYGDAVDKLSAYENTGLEPEEINALIKSRERYIAIAEWNGYE